MNQRDLLSLIEEQPSVQLTSLADNYPSLSVNNQYASATIALHGAHITAFTPNNEQAVIFTSKEAVYKEGKAIRGGIPICWPWFGAHLTEPNFPAHGFARNRFWQLTSVTESNDATTLTFKLPITPNDHPMIGGIADVLLTVSIGRKLVVELKCTNTGLTDISIGGALHSYFAISDISDVSLSGLSNTTHLDSLTGETSLNPGSIQFDQEYDRIFQPSSATTEITDSGLNRTIIIEKKGSMGTTVWNPWIHKSQEMADLGNEEYLQFLCIEAINWREDTRLLKPTESHTLAQTIYLA